MGTRIDITIEGLRQLGERVDRRQIEGDDWVVVGALVSGLLARTEARHARLRAKADQQAAKNKSDDAGSSSGVAHPASAEGTGETGKSGPPAEGGTGESARPGPAEQEPPKKPGHGRNGADAFTDASIHLYHLAAGIIGALCTVCGVGPIFPYRDKVIIRVVGQPLFAAGRHQFQQGRCRLCGAIFTAESRERVQQGIGTSYITYAWSACAMLLVMHYFAGAPFKRLEALQAGWGVPMPDANQWRLADECDDLLAPLYKALERHAIQNATTLRFDDTGSMIIETRRRIQQEVQTLEQLGESTKHVRTGINATGIYIETDAAKVVLFFTGRHHAGEVVDQLLEHRRRTRKLVTVTDATSKNFSHGHADKLEQAVCHAHCYMKFRGIKALFPAEYAVAAEVYGEIFGHDDKAAALGLDSNDRMAYHREHSKPLMLKLWQMCRDKLDSKLVEPNSPLWEPVAFVINQWPRLTRFYEVPGVPLDSNLVEQALIIPVRYLAGSFAYKTQTGADVGDRHMSLIATANANGVEPVAYLTECMRNHGDLTHRPEHYLPWVYRDRGKEPVIPPGVDALPTSSPIQPGTPEIRHPLRPGTHRAPRSTATMERGADRDRHPLDD